MLRMGKETKQSPQAVLDKAAAFFGPAGLGLTLHQRSEEFVAFQGGGGYVTVTATRTAEDDRTTVDLESREWDYPVRQFLGEI